ncbi:unnamed protein product [Amaranthus hypochondriacus]
MNLTNSILFFIFIFIISAIADQRFDDCAPIKSSCGSKFPIAYPFWDSRIPNYCGLPSFMVECENDSSLTITINDQKYTVLDINYSKNVLTISKSQFSNGPCPPKQNQLVNSTFDTKLLTYTSNTQYATLYYDCQPFKLGSNPIFGFSCSFSSSGNTYDGSSSGFHSDLGYMAINTTDVSIRKYCHFRVEIPILKSMALQLVNGKSNIQNVLRKGFEMKWRIADDGLCEDCSKSGGRCGYDTKLKQPTCFCENEADGSNCKALNAISKSAAAAGKKSTKITPIALGVGIGVITLLSGLLCIFLYQWRRKKDASKEIPSYNSYGSSNGASIFPFLQGSTYFGVNVFNYRELEEATDYFNPLKELGEGGFGTVYHGKLQDGREVAIKRLYKNNNKQAEQFLNEVEILANLRHKNLVNLYGCTSRQSRELLLVYEFIPNGTVADHLHGKKSKLGLLPWSTRLSIATETASALVYLHDSDIIHRDVKTQNILLCNDFSVKVADFGLSRLFPLDVTHVSTAPQGTPGYVDPEYHQCYHLTEKSDVYSFGVVLAELISSLPAVDITRHRTDINLSNMAINKIQNHALHEFVDPSLGYQSDFKVKKEITKVTELTFHCLQSTKEMRPTMNEVYNRLLSIQDGQESEMDSAEVVDIPADDVLMLKGDFSPSSPQREEYHLVTCYKPYASV